jgi:glycosyltransferase involved in cell wall biosynthesis
VEHIELDDVAPYRGRFFGRILYIAAFVLRAFPFISRVNYRDQRALRALAGRRWDVVLANDVETLPLARRLAPRTGVLADVHEYATRQNEHSFAWRLLQSPYYRWLVRKHLSRATVVTTVSGGLADEYQREFGISAGVVTNASALHDLQPSGVHSPIRLVHSGFPAVQRRLELMIEAVQLSRANVVFDLYLLDDGSEYLASLKERARGDDRIRFRPPVQSSELVTVLNDYDVGLCILPPTTFNLAWCLPNKFFDYIQARLAVIVGPSPEMQRVVDETAVGRVTDDFTVEAIAKVIDELKPETIAMWKRASHSHAAELSSGPQSDIWVEAIRRMIGATTS